MLPETTIHFGAVGKPLPDWRTLPDEPDADDEELAETPADVIALLGFDPKEFSEVLAANDRDSADLARRRFLGEAKAQLGAAYMEALQPVRIELANALDGDEANLRERLEIFRSRLPALLTRVTAEPAARERLAAIFSASFFNGMNPDRTA